jgi:hypothetical protein
MIGFSMIHIQGCLIARKKLKGSLTWLSIGQKNSSLRYEIMAM